MSKDRYLIAEARFRPSLGGWQARVHGCCPTRGKIDDVHTKDTFDRWPAAIRTALLMAEELAKRKELFPTYRPQTDSRIPPFAERQRAIEFFQQREREKAS